MRISTSVYVLKRMVCIIGRIEQGILDTRLTYYSLALCLDNIKTDLNQMNDNLNKKSIQNALEQGLLYLDGRNSQKYLHQTQAYF